MQYEYNLLKLKFGELEREYAREKLSKKPFGGSALSTEVEKPPTSLMSYLPIPRLHLPDWAWTFINWGVSVASVVAGGFIWEALECLKIFLPGKI